MRKRKKLIMTCICAVLLCIIMQGLLIIFHPAYESRTYASSAVSVLDNIEFTPFNAEFSEDQTFLPTATDAQLYINGIKETVSAIDITFQHPLTEGTVCQLYYSIDGSGLNEGYSIIKEVKDNTKEIVFDLPQIASYDYFRLDIDTEYSISDLSVYDDSVIQTKSYWETIISGNAAFPVGQFCIIILLIAAITFIVYIKANRVQENITRTRAAYNNQRHIFLKSVFLWVGCVLLCIILWIILSLTKTISSSSNSLFYFIVVGNIAGGMLTLRKQFGEHPERGFVIIALSIGLLFAVLEPPTMDMSWDDQIHYMNALQLSYGGTQYYTPAEMAVANFQVSSDITLANVQSLDTSLNQIINNHASVYTDTSLPFYIILSYLPSAIGMMIARLIGLSFTAIVVAGRIGNLLCYTIVVFFAIKQLKEGKLLVSTLATIPTVLFLAGNYSYDPICIAFILLGVCIWLGNYQDPNEQLSLKKAIGMLSAFTMGLLPKPVYLPIILVVFFLPKAKFPNKKTRNRFYFTVFLFAAFVFAAFALPFVTKTTTYTDNRGGNEVDAIAQIRYILSNPFTYIGNLFRFMYEVYFQPYMVMGSSSGCVRAMAYLSLTHGITFPEELAVVYLFILFIVWLSTENDKCSEIKQPTKWLKVLIFFIAFGTICIAATSMYCAFTAVGADTIWGFQERYMLPIVLPTLLIIHPIILKYAINKQRFNTIVLYLEIIVLLLGLWPLVQRYM